MPATVATAFLRVRSGVATLVRGAGPDRGYLVTRADVGASIVGRLVATNAAGTVTADTPASAAVLPAPPSGGTPTIEGLPAVVDRPLTVAPGAWDNGGAPGRPAVTAIRWFACGAVCALVGRDARYVPVPDDVGRALLAEVDVANAAGTVTGTSARTAAVVPGAPEFLAPPAVAGTARVGETLTATTPAIAAHGAAVTVATAWFACRSVGVATCSTPAAGAASHLIAEAERGLRLRVRVLASGAGGSVVSWSAPTEPVLGRNECLLVAPGRITVCVGASSRVTVEARLDRRRVVAGREALVTGRLTVTGDVPRPDLVTLVHGGRAELAAVDRAGNFALRVRPVLSERISVSVRIAGRSEPLGPRGGRGARRARAARAIRRPARRGGHRPRPPRRRHRRPASAGGRVPAAARGTHAAGPRGRPDLPRRRAAGGPRRPLRRPLPVAVPARAARYRVRFLPGPGAPLDAAVTPWQRAALR